MTNSLPLKFICNPFSSTIDPKTCASRLSNASAFSSIVVEANEDRVVVISSTLGSSVANVVVDACVVVVGRLVEGGLHLGAGDIGSVTSPDSIDSLLERPPSMGNPSRGIIRW